MKETFRRVFKTGWLNYKRNAYLSFGTTGIMTLVLLLFAGLMVVNYVSAQIVTGLQSKVDVTVYFKQDATETEIVSVQHDLQGLNTVQNVSYTSQEQALANFKDRHAGDALIQESLAELTDNPLEASLNIKAKQSSDYPTIVTFLEGNAYRPVVDKINYYENEAVINRVEGISNGIRNWGLLATLVLAAVAILVTFNTIRLTIYNQKQEIEIMRLVGGSNWHIRGPYLIEGGIYGVVAAGLTALIFYPTLWFVSSKASALLSGVSLIGYFVSNIGEFIALVLVAGVALGVVSSSIAIRRFLKI
ncbi:MAG TPA: permease-like cell division protein FtsX [Candidatus Paceibacterota bacterium]|nr:permease-like cell division protein FtsX [Candidatus Paceibacterota bacterium]